MWDALTPRHGTNARCGLPALLQLTAAEPSPHVHDSRVAIDVGALERYHSSGRSPFPTANSRIAR
jgi:hypothetical protein